MESLLRLIANSSFQWMWLGSQIVSTNPFTVHVLCLQTCTAYEPFRTFAVSAIPWTSHNSESHLYTIRNGDSVLILTDNPKDTEQAVKRASAVVDAYRARYFLVQYSYIDENTIQDLIRSAWSKKLTQVVVIRLSDTAIHAVLPAFKLPRVIQVSKVKWPNLRKIDMSNCTLKIATVNAPPTLQFHGTDDSTYTGLYAPFYKYIKVALKFKAVLIPTTYTNMTHELKSGKADIIFAPLRVVPYFPIEATCLTNYQTELRWCVPDSCVLGSTNYFLWREYTLTLWLMLAGSALAVTFAVWWVTPTYIQTLLDSLFTVFQALASAPVKNLPRGHSRGVFGGWLLAMLVLSTAYQTVLHSMMAAPLIAHEIEDRNDLLKSELTLICTPITCSALKDKAKEDSISDEIAARSQLMSSESGMRFVQTRQETHALYTTHRMCFIYYARMRAMVDEGAQPSYYGLFGVLPSSQLAPVLRQLSERLEASGLTAHWFFRNFKKIDCLHTGDKESQPLTVALLWPAILLLCGGLSVGFVVFLIEIWWFSSKRKRIVPPK